MDYLPVLPITVTPLLALGMMLVIGAIGGFVAHRLSWLPSITGFMLIGLSFGPSGLGIFTEATLVNARVFVDIALTLILYRLGLSLDLKIVASSPKLIVSAFVESSLTFLFVVVALTPFAIPLAVSTLVAAVVISSSPAVLLHVAHELNASGRVTEETKSLVALNNLIAFVVFSISLPTLHYESGDNLTTIVLQPTYQLSGSLLLGIALGKILHFLATQTAAASQYKLALVIGVLVVSIALANAFNLSGLFTALVIGILIRTAEEDNLISGLEFGPAFELFFILLFVYAGASLHVHALVQFFPAVMALVIARSAAKVFGSLSVGWVLKEPVRGNLATGMLLLPMAGLAIGLTYTSSSMFPEFAATISAVVLGSVTVFETIGPPIAAFAFKYAGEAKNT